MLEEFATQFLQTNALRVATSNTAQILAGHIQMMVFNVISIAAAVALLQDSKVIEATHVHTADRDYKLSCNNPRRGQAGGSMTSSEFFGVNSGAYTSGNGSQGTVTSQVDFAGGIARPALGPMQSGGGAALTYANHAAIKRYMKLVLEYNSVKVSKGGKVALYSVIDACLKCLATVMKQDTVSKDKKLLAFFAKSKQFAVFN